ncbi:MAG TPA: sugar-transfer associated ATP-grasp domain-containing protein [Longimicrobiales bacterium]|jgi:hypothetical protein
MSSGGGGANEEAIADMVELRRLSRQVLWSVRSHWERSGWVDRGWARLGLPRTLINLLFVLPREVVSTLRLAGREVRTLHGVSRLRQLRQMIGLAFREGLFPAEYYLFALYEDGRRPLAPLFLGPRNNGDSLVAAVGSRDPRQSKLEFFRRCTAAGLPTVPLLAECSNRGGSASIHEADSPLWQGDLCSKPADSGAAQGIRIWSRQEDGAWRDGDAVARDRDELLSVLSSSTRHDIWIVQPRLRTHRDLADLTTGALCNVRMNTVRDPTTGAVEILFAMFRMPLGADVRILRPGDGVYAGVDLDTGRLGMGGNKATHSLPRYTEVHPTTGGRIEGRVLPYWSEVLDLSRRVHDAFPEIPAAGWDISIIDSGPVLVETNEMWACDLIQAVNGIPIGLTPYPRIMLKYLRAAMTRRALQRRF